MSIGQGITLITGLPGAGKTALCVKFLSEIQNRPLFVMGIPDLAIEHNPCPPVEEWVEERPDPNDASLKLPYFRFPANSIIVLDEAQRVYRPRAVGSLVPPIVSAFETRRHTGVDFVLLTQHPNQIDNHVRRLVNRHIHIHVTPLGTYKLEWQGVGEIENKASRDLAVREKYSPPKEVFNLYKSAELHTKPVVRRPWLVYAFVPMLLALIAGGFYVKNRIDVAMNPQAQSATGPITASADVIPSASPKTSATASEPMTTREYIEHYQPRIAGLMHTAPAYDEITKPAIAPEPVGCMESTRTGCKCYTQQGTPYDTNESLCKQIMAKGLFMPWKTAESTLPEPSRVKTGNDRSRSDLANVPEPYQPTVSTLPMPEPVKLSPTPKNQGPSV